MATRAILSIKNWVKLHGNRLQIVENNRVDFLCMVRLDIDHDNPKEDHACLIHNIAS